MMKLSRWICMVCVAALLCTSALAGEIGEMVTPTPVPALDAGEIGEATTNRQSSDIESEGGSVVTPAPAVIHEGGEIGEMLSAKAALAGLVYELTGGVLDAEGNWLYATGDMVSWQNLPEGSMVGMQFSIANYAEKAAEAQVQETVDGTAFERGTVVIDSGKRYSFWRYYATPAEAARHTVYTVNGETAAEGTITFALTGAPEGVTVDISACEMDGSGAWVRDFGDTVRRAQIDVGQHWGYVMHVCNSSAEKVTVRVCDSVNGSLYNWGDVTVEANGSVDLPVKLRGTLDGERSVYCVVNGEKVAEKVLKFIQN